MERPLHDPDNRNLPPEAVDVSGLKPAKIIHSEIAPPSPSLARWQQYRQAAEAELGYIAQEVEQSMQREAIARAALLGETPERWRGIHQRNESFGEIAQDEIVIRLKRLVGGIAALGSQLRGLFSRQPCDYGKLEDIGFGASPTSDFSMNDATHVYTAEELAEIRAYVASSYKNRGKEAGA
jgi:hypothetical protein